MLSMVGVLSVNTVVFEPRVGQGHRCGGWVGLGWGAESDACTICIGSQNALGYKQDKQEFYLAGLGLSPPKAVVFTLNRVPETV